MKKSGNQFQTKNSTEEFLVIPNKIQRRRGLSDKQTRFINSEKTMTDLCGESHLAFKYKLHKDITCHTCGKQRHLSKICFSKKEMSTVWKKCVHCHATRRDETNSKEYSKSTKRTIEITVNSEEQNAVFVCISNSSEFHNSDTLVRKACDGFTTKAEFKRLSDAERIMVENLDINQCRPRHIGRFLTIHRRRRKRLMTRSLNQEPGILDDIFHGLVQCVLEKAGNWQFNAFTLETVSGGRSLPVLCVHLFHWYGLLHHFNLDVVTVWKLFAFIEEGYHSTNPYHNSIHAADVTQAMHCFLQEKKIKTHITNLEIMASLIAAVTHDLDHPGVNQPFLVATSNHLAALYKNTSVLENHHWRSAIGCLLESGVSAQLPDNIRPKLEWHIKSLILATDITRQQEFLTCFKDHLANNSLEMQHAEDRHFILQIALKCADISNPCRPWDISRKWSYKVCEEFFKQGDYERRLNLPVTPLCDRHTTSIPKIQAGFFKHVVTPLYVEWHHFLSDDLSVSLMKHLKANQKRWEILINQDVTEEMETEISELDKNEDIASSGEETSIDEDSNSIDLLIPTAYVQTTRMQTLPGRIGLNRVDRRHSIPLNASKSLILSSRQTLRRESLPIEKIKAKNVLLKLEEQSLLKPNTTTLMSSKNSIVESNTSIFEKSISTENLLPETSIASIISNTEVSRLNTFLKSNNKASMQTKQLTRQQTFPPLQSHVRMKHVSTMEMTQCYTHILKESNGSFSCSTFTKDKSCSSGCSSLSPLLSHDAILYHQKSNVLKTSKELLMIDMPIKKQSPTSSDIIKLKYIVSSKRCHSMKTINTDDFLSTHQYKRSCSAQDNDSTQIFYALLTSYHNNKSNHISDMSRYKDSDCNIEHKYCNTKSMFQESQTTLSCKKLDQNTLIKNIYSPQESRRYSIPITKHNTIMINNTGRRYTAIPVSSELNVHKVFFIGSPRDSPHYNYNVSSSNESYSESNRCINDSSNEIIVIGNKRELDYIKGKNSKVIKLNSNAQMKENVDPHNDDFNKAIALFHRNNQGLTRRRGSAPVGLSFRVDDFIPTSISRIDHNCRRGSVPADITKHQDGSCRFLLGSKGENLSTLRRTSLPQEIMLGNLSGNILTGEFENFSIKNNNINNTSNSNNNGINKLFDSAVSRKLCTRRGSIPADTSELHHDLLNKNSINSKICRMLSRRRSSEGPEMFIEKSIIEGNDNGTYLKYKQEIGKCNSIPDILAKRRGSLPIEIVAVSHAGSIPASRRASMWRL